MTLVSRQPSTGGGRSNGRGHDEVGEVPENGTWTIPTVNRQVAEKFRDAADLLEQQGANPFRIEAYRRAADTVTERRGPLAGRRVVRGRETECTEYYATHPALT